MRRQGCEQPVCKQDVQQAAFVHQDQVAVDGVIGISTEGSVRTVEFEETRHADGDASHGFRQTVGGVSRRRAEPNLHAFCVQDRKDRLQDRGLPHSGTAREDRHLGRERGDDGVSLRSRQCLDWSLTFEYEDEDRKTKKHTFRLNKGFHPKAVSHFNFFEWLPWEYAQAEIKAD